MKNFPTLINLCKELWPLNRSLTGKGTFQTLNILKKYNQKLKIKNFITGEKCFDWVVPQTWNVKEAFIITPDNKKICNYESNNLHLVGYSKSINMKIKLKNLKKKLYSTKKLKKAIPYLTTYYKKDWGFCISENQKRELKDGIYHAYINSKFSNGKMNYGEYFIKGKSKKEIFFSTYICHPSMANNELSGPVLASAIINYLKNKKNYYSYRFVFIPETIGSICYIHKNYNNLKKKVLMGFNLTCVGDEKKISFLPSKYINSPGDKIIINLFSNNKKFKFYDWKDRGSDERQYCSPLVDLPISSLMKTKYGEFKEYHNSEDKIGTTVTSKGLSESFKIYKKIITEIENNFFPLAKKPCEPFLTKYKLYDTLSGKDKKNNNSKDLLDFLTWCDGKNSLNEISLKNKFSSSKTKRLLNILLKNNLIKIQ